MTLEEARDHIGEGVVYTAPHGAREDGVITGVSSRVVFVRYAGDQTAKGTYAADLTLLAAGFPLAGADEIGTEASDFARIAKREGW